MDAGNIIHIKRLCDNKITLDTYWKSAKTSLAGDANPAHVYKGTVNECGIMHDSAELMIVNLHHEMALANLIYSLQRFLSLGRHA